MRGREGKGKVDTQAVLGKDCTRIGVDREDSLVVAEQQLCSPSAWWLSRVLSSP